MALHALCLFDGYGGFELGLRCAGIDLLTVARVERDSHAAATLVARMEETHLDSAPIWDDVCTFDGGPWRGRVDIVTAGFNCQPFSAAGRSLGVDDERWLWPNIARIVADVGPRFVFLENVPRLVRLGGLDHICGDLAALGFDAEWGLLSAAAVGAPHKRERFWLLAHTNRDGQSSVGRSGARQERDADRSGGADVADPSGVRGVQGRRQQQPEPDRRRITPQDGAWPPRPDDLTGWERWRDAGGPEPSIRRSTHGRPLGLAESLHLGGNGLVPSVAGHAFVQLAERLEIDVGTLRAG